MRAIEARKTAVYQFGCLIAEMWNRKGITNSHKRKVDIACIYSNRLCFYFRIIFDNKIDYLIYSLNRTVII